MRIALVGTRGPGHYGGFETCVAEVASRLADEGHDVIVYARRWSPSRRWRHPGARVVVLPSVPTKNLDTITHTLLCTLHLLVRRPEAVVVFGVGNSPFAWVLRTAGLPVVLNVDGLDRARAKWGRFARWYLSVSERLSPRAAHVVVTDAKTIEDYYERRHGVRSRFIVYGAPSGPERSTTSVEAAGLEPGRYILYVSRLEPENNAHVAIEAHAASGSALPLVVVGGSAYGGDYEQRLREEAGPGVIFLGFVFGQGYRELQSNALLYLQCTEVGGTHPALVEAMGFGNAIIALDTPEHREVLGDAGTYYRSAGDLAAAIERLVDDDAGREELRRRARGRAQERFSWDAVAAEYVDACRSAAERT